ncbi:hypothetical protein ACPEIC_29040 [Stenotrophomonas sp. NPDC087984]
MALNPLEADDMAHAIAWIFEALLRLLPLSGRHRAAELPGDGLAVHGHAPTMAVRRTGGW